MSAIMHWKDTQKHWEWGAFAAVLFVLAAALMFNRWQYADGCLNDFRYIYPIIIGSNT